MSTTPEVSLRITAQDGASDILRKIQAQLSSTGNAAGVFNQKVATEGVAGLGKLSSGFEHLARSALGFGRAEASIAVGIAESFGATIPVLLGVSAAIGLGVEAWKHYEEPIKKAREATERWIESQQKAARVRFDPSGGLKDDIASRETQLASITARLANARAEDGTVQSFGGGDPVIIDNTREINRLTKEQTELTDGLTAARANLQAKGDSYIKSLIDEQNNLRFGAKAAKEMAVANDESLTPAQRAAALAILRVNEALMAQKTAADAAAKAALAAANAAQHFGSPGNNLGGQSDLTRNGASAAQQQAMTDAANAGGGFINGTGSAGPIGGASDQVKGLASSFADMGKAAEDSFVSAITGGKSFVDTLDDVRKALGKRALAQGLYDSVAAISAFARGLFGDPLGFAAAKALAVSAGEWFAVSAVLGGGGGGGSSKGSGGTTQSLSSTNQPLAERGTLTIVKPPKGAYSSWSDPGFQEFIQKTVAAANGRRVVFA